MSDDLVHDLYEKSIVLSPGGMGEAEDEMIRWFDYHKFAELIVRECAGFTDHNTRKFMFKHFGIED